MARDRRRIIIGIDFGTTCSGIAWTDTSQRNPEVLSIRQWPHSTYDMDKVPSEALYPHDIRQPGTIKYMKLLLDLNQEQKGATPGLADPLQLVQMLQKIPPEKQPVDVVKEYLCWIKEYALSVLSRYLGPEFWEAIPVEYRLTVPAVWSETAKSLTLKAAHGAGLGLEENKVLISEPEAAAIYCFAEPFKDLLKRGDVFVVADCGGGTVDLITYKILSRYPRIQVKELGVGGGLCGSVFLNRRFENFVRKRIEDKMMDYMIHHPKKLFAETMKAFEENLKRNFRNSPDQEFMDCILPGVPDNAAQRVVAGYLEITRGEMAGVFDPVVNQVIRLVRQQIDIAREKDKVSAVLMVGGFAASPYLHQRLSDEITAYYGKIPILQPPNAWSAAARGAVIAGLHTIDISTRQAPRSYGIRYNKRWEFGDQRKYRYWCPLREEWRCDNRIDWCVQKGEEVSDTTQIALHFSCCFFINEPLTVTTELLASDSPVTHLETNSRHHNVYKIRQLRTNFSCLRHRLRVRTTSHGRKFYDLHYKLVMKIHSASQLSFALRYDGVTYGDIVTAQIH